MVTSRETVQDNGSNSSVTAGTSRNEDQRTEYHEHSSIGNPIQVGLPTSKNKPFIAIKK